MTRAVLDANVILAALLSRRDAAFEILGRLRRGEWRLVLSNHLLLEYEEVLKRNDHGNWKDFDRIMARVPDAPPVPGDER